MAAGVGGGRRGEADVEGLLVGLTLHLVERALVGGGQRAGGAVRSDARRATGGVKIARALRSGREVATGDGGTRDEHRGQRQRERHGEQEQQAGLGFHEDFIAVDGVGVSGC